MESSDSTSSAISAAANEGMGTNNGTNGLTGMPGSSANSNPEQDSELADKATGALGSAKQKPAELKDAIGARPSKGVGGDRPSSPEEVGRAD